MAYQWRSLAEGVWLWVKIALFLVSAGAAAWGVAHGARAAARPLPAWNNPATTSASPATLAARIKV